MYCEINFSFHSRPMSSNEYKVGRGKSGRACFFAKKDLPLFKETVGRIALVNMNLKGYRITGAPVSATVKYYFKDRRGDASNFHKAIFDALQGVVYKNDSQVGDNTINSRFLAVISLMKFKDPYSPRVDLCLSWNTDNEPIEKQSNKRKTK